jgi:hypothetical protein
MLNAEETERIRGLLVDWTPDIRRRALAEALSLDERSRMAVVVACDISGTTLLSDEIVELLAATWREWPTLTRLCLRQCALLSASGCAIIARQGKFTSLELSGARALDDSAIQTLATLPLQRLEFWDADQITAMGAVSLARIPSLRTLEWHNAPNDPTVTSALAQSRTIEILHFTCKDCRSEVIEPLCTMEQLTSLHVFSIDDSALDSIARLHRLMQLNVDSSPLVTDLGMETISRLTQLRTLRLSQTSISTAGLSAVRSLLQLEEICLHARPALQISDATAADLGNLPHLRKINFHGTLDLSDAGVSALTAGGMLVELNLRGCGRVTDRSLPMIARLTNLTSLNLSGTSVTDAGLAHLAGLAALTDLSLAQTALTPEGLTFLKPLTALRTLDLSGCVGVAPMTVNPLLGMSELRELNLQEAGALSIHDARLLSQHCRQLTEIRCGLGETGSATELASLEQLCELWVSSAGDLQNQDLAAFQASRSLKTLVVVDAPWLTDEGLDLLRTSPSLRSIGIAGCPGLSSKMLAKLARERHLDLIDDHGRRTLGRGSYSILRGQLVTDGLTLAEFIPAERHSLSALESQVVEGYIRSTDITVSRRVEQFLTHSMARDTPDFIAAIAERSARGMRDSALLASLRLLPSFHSSAAFTLVCTLASEPPQIPAAIERGIARLSAVDPEEVCEESIRLCERSLNALVMPNLQSILAIGPTRWAYAGWALVRMALHDVDEARLALIAASLDKASAMVRYRATRFLEILEKQ